MKDILKSIPIKLTLNLFVAVLLISLTTEANGSYGVVNGGRWLIVLAMFILGAAYAVIIAKQDSTRVIHGVHYKQWLLRTIYVGALPAILILQSGDWSHLWPAFLSATIFYFLFDIYLNDYKGYDLSYVGRESLIDCIVWWLGIQPIYMVVRLALVVVVLVGNIIWYL